MSSTAITATVERMQAEMVTASKKIEELSNAAQKSEGVQDLHEKITLTNKKLKELQTKKDVFELTSGLEAVRAEVGVIRTQMEALSEKDKKLVELREAVISLQKKIQKIDSQQVSHGDVSKIKTKLQNLQKAFTSLENQTSSNVEIVREQIDSVQWKIHATVWSDRKQNQSRLDETVKDYSARLDQMKHFIVCVVIVGMCFLHSISISSFSSKEELKVLQASSAEIKQFVFENTHFLKDESACQASSFFGRSPTSGRVLRKRSLLHSVVFSVNHSLWSHTGTKCALLFAQMDHQKLTFISLCMRNYLEVGMTTN